MSEPTRTYPHGVPCWVDSEQEDPAAAQAFYAGLLGWAFTDVGAGHGGYWLAQLDGRDVAAIGPASPGGGPAWTTYVAVQDADAGAAAVRDAGGEVHMGPLDAGPGGRLAVCADPEGAAFRLWQPRRRLGAQVVNEPGAWNWSTLRSADTDGAERFYGAVFGWVAGHPPAEHAGAPILLQQPGYGEHLAASADPDVFARQAAVGAPTAFADAVGWLEPGDGPAGWSVTFSVADRDDAAARAEQLGGVVLGSEDGVWAKLATIRDPQGAELTLSQFSPPGQPDGA